jgi:HK97 family phage prohead protease
MKNTLEHKPISLELKDLDSSKRTAVIAHAVYGVIDRVGDISCKGMFDKTWKENKSIDFLFNHNEEEVVGSVLRTFDDEEKAYTEVKFGNWTLGNDVLEMADMGVLKGASFGYNTEKKEFATVKGKKVRKLKEVYHGETSLLTKIPANPLAGIVKLNKSFEQIPEFKSLSQSEQQILKSIISADQSALEQLFQLWTSLEPSSDLYTSLSYALGRRIDIISEIRWQLKYNAEERKSIEDHIIKMEKFCSQSKASDECIISMQNEIQEAKQILSNYDTVTTQPITEPDTSRNENDSFLRQLLILKTKI